jgi:hypothetical protein
VDPRVINYGLNWAPIATTPVEAFVIGVTDPSTADWPNLWTM